jgi:hypothetical protein
MGLNILPVLGGSDKSIESDHMLQEIIEPLLGQVERVPKTLLILSGDLLANFLVWNCENAFEL